MTPEARPAIDGSTGSVRTRAALYAAALLGINVYLVYKLFFLDFTDNMQTNAGSFMAISRFILLHWPHLDWFPWWFNGIPFENSYTPMLHLVDAAFALVTGCSVGRAFNFVTAFFYATGPVFLFLFAWRISRFLETSFFAALLYSLFSLSVIFPIFRTDVGGWWNPWRLRVLVYYGEGPHTAVLGTLPLALLLIYLAITRRKYVWCVAAAVAMAFVTLTNAFGAIDLAIGSACLILALPKRQIVRAALLTCGLAIAAYLWASPFLTPALIRTISKDSQSVGGNFSGVNLFSTQALIVPGFICVWFAVRRIGDYFLRFSILFAYGFLHIVAFFALGNLAALPQPHRYSLEMELALSLALAFSLRPLAVRLPRAARFAVVAAILMMTVHQTVHYRRYARTIVRPVDITQTIEYKTAKWIDRHLGDRRAFVTAQTGTWLNVFADTPQMHSGHDPFNPNWVEEAATYAIYSGQNAGAKDAETSILWLKAYGCHAIHVVGPHSRVDGKPFVHPEKFNGVLPVLWREEDDTIYSVPQRTGSLAHVVPQSAIVKRQPIHGLDTAEVAVYVGALDDASLPDAEMTWSGPAMGRLSTVLHPGQVISMQVNYDVGWVARANGRSAAVTRDGIGLTVIHTDCDGPCAVEFTYDGGLARKTCRALSWMTTAATLMAGVFVFGRRKSQARSSRTPKHAKKLPAVLS